MYFVSGRDGVITGGVTSSFITPFRTSPVCVPLTNRAIRASSISFG